MRPLRIALVLRLCVCVCVCRVCVVCVVVQVLLLHLKRFMFDGSAAHKTTTRVEFPQSLSLEEFYSKVLYPKPRV
jgi:hypothetical protein